MKAFSLLKKSLLSEVKVSEYGLLAQLLKVDYAGATEAVRPVGAWPQFLHFFYTSTISKDKYDKFSEKYFEISTFIQ